MALEKKSTADDADKSSEKVSKKSSDKNSAKSAEKDKGSKKTDKKTERKSKADKSSKKSSSSKKKHPERSGNPAKSRAAANRVSRTPKKVKDTASPRWYAPTMVTLLVIGLLWVVTTYLFQGKYPLPYFVEHHVGDWLFNGNLYIGFLIMMSGFLGLLRWK